MRVRGIVAYDGAPFHGFAANLGVPTVAASLDAALSRALRVPVSVTCAGRTDRGVHAVGQVISFDAPDEADLARVRRSVNRQCRPSVVVTTLDRAPDDFDARFSAIGRTYRYRILNRLDADPFTSPLAWHVPGRLDVDAMEAAAALLVGLHDFISFCRLPTVRSDGTMPTLVRRITGASWRWLDPGLSGIGLLEFEVSASAFCHQMVRTMVGTLVDVGSGRLTVDSIPEILAARDRRASGEPAPPWGLTFWSVAYPPDALSIPDDGHLPGG
ncbi:MAG: tRNA pseudouridine(38-40) synthase TruA [Actinomycetota bacterium]|jgi:tRNA pseudouridine38-40 synthase|nr:tRNA pseudouridine(38-40) synthase TruA [Actinomycetota bacterium]